MFNPAQAGKQIAHLRKSKGITQEDLASRLFVSPQAVSKWENGRAMPEVSVLVELAGILEKPVDAILLPSDYAPECANFERILLPYDEVADFTGQKWLRSMAKPALLAAIKLLMGLEERRDALKRQCNDDTEYILQSAFTSICFGYSWGRDMCEGNCLAVYGLTSEAHERENDTDEAFIRRATAHIEKGYPVVIEPKEYTDLILATGYLDHGKTLKGLPFLDGDDAKNAVMSFRELTNFTDWYKGNVRMLLIKPAGEKMPVADACRQALWEGYHLLSNEQHRFEEPLVGYGLVIYDNWCRELKKETNQNLENIECLYPHIFIHYENKQRVKEFLELCIHLVPGINSEAMRKAVSKYEELIRLCHRSMQEWLKKKPENLEEARHMRRGFEWMLGRSRELEREALESWAAAMENKE